MRRLYIYMLVLRYVQLLQKIKVTETRTGTDTVLGEYLYNANGQRVKKAVNGKGLKREGLKRGQIYLLTVKSDMSKMSYVANRKNCYS